MEIYPFILWEGENTLLLVWVKKVFFPLTLLFLFWTFTGSHIFRQKNSSYANGKVNRIDSVNLELIKTNLPSLLIIVKGQNLNSGYTNIRLDPFVYVHPPLDGIWEFTMIGEVPHITDQVITDVSAEYTWKDFPKGLKGIKVYGQTNSKTAMLVHETGH
jgi:hypothetical protein